MEQEEYTRMAEVEALQWWYAGMRAITGALLQDALPDGHDRDRACLLDAGCGTGINLAELSRFGRTTGIDLSPQAVWHSRARGGRVARGNVLDMPFAAGRFDIVVSLDVLYHRWVVDDAAAVAELARVLKPGGTLFVRVAALEILRGAHDAAVHTRRRYRRRQVVSLLKGAGLEIQRATYANGLLFPLLLARRLTDRLCCRSGSDITLMAPPLESILLTILRVEAFLLRYLDLPLGGSVVAVARKPAAGPL